MLEENRHLTSKSDKNVIFDKNGKNRNFVKIGVFWHMKMSLSIILVKTSKTHD